MHMIAGPNGAGKSTLYELRLRPYTDAVFINADLIQRDELQDRSMAAAYRAADVAEARRREHLAQRKSFVSESTFSHPSKLELIEAARAAGFRVIVHHVSVRSAELSVLRVAKRHEEGGHNVPEDKIRERYARNPGLIRSAVLQADRAYVYDNSRLNVSAPTVLIAFHGGVVTRVADAITPWAQALYAAELAQFSRPA